jgi:hypothetical protein
MQGGLSDHVLLEDTDINSFRSAINLIRPKLSTEFWSIASGGKYYWVTYQYAFAPVLIQSSGQPLPGVQRAYWQQRVRRHCSRQGCQAEPATRGYGNSRVSQAIAECRQQVDRLNADLQRAARLAAVRCSQGAPTPGPAR